MFNDALSKQANHTRVVFMDINTPDDGRGDVRPLFLTTVRDRLRAWEGTAFNGQPRPAAYVLMTNAPWEYDLDGPAGRSTCLAEGFQIPDFKEDAMFPTLRAAINARKAHQEIRELVQSIADHSEIPSTFGGELDVYSHDDAPVPPRTSVRITERHRIHWKIAQHTGNSTTVQAGVLNCRAWSR